MRMWWVVVSIGCQAWPKGPASGGRTIQTFVIGLPWFAWFGLCKPMATNVRSKLGQLLVWACGAPFQNPREDRPEGQGREVRAQGMRLRHDGVPAVSAGAGSSDLHCAYFFVFGQAVSRPCWRPRNHPCCYEEQQKPALQIWRVQQGRTPREWQQALLHQPVGHVLAL